MKNNASTIYRLVRRLDDIQTTFLKLSAQLTYLQIDLEKFVKLNLPAEQSDKRYYVKSPLGDSDVINQSRTISEMYWAVGREDDYWHSQFTQAELDVLKHKMLTLDIEALKVRVEEYDNEHA